jgi:hypothetical protein
VRDIHFIGPLRTRSSSPVRRTSDPRSQKFTRISNCEEIEKGSGSGRAPNGTSKGEAAGAVINSGLFRFESSERNYPLRLQKLGRSQHL